MIGTSRKTVATQDDCRLWSVGVVFVLAAVVLLAACVAGDRRIDSQQKASIHRIAVHPMEPPPLVVPTSLTLSGVRTGDVGAFGILGLIAGGVVVVAQSDSISREAGLWESHASGLDASRIWQPTEVVARQVVSALEGQGRYEVQLNASMTNLFVGEKRGRFDPYGPVRAWYNSNEATESARGSEADVVLEVGLLHYEIAPSGELIIGILVRAVDPATGKVLGRASAYAWPPAPEMESLFADEAQPFKALFTDTTNAMTKHLLAQLGLQ